MFSPKSSFALRGSIAALALATMGGAAVYAQTSSAPASSAAPAVNFQSYAAPQLFTAPVEASSSSSSSSAVDAPSVDLATVPVDPLHLNAMQYERRRYGRPRYRGSNTNADGSDKYIFYVGGGFTQPSGNTWKYYTPSWGFQVGGGRQFSAKFAVPVEFNYDNFGLTRQTVGNQFTLYNNQINFFCNENPAYCAQNGITTYASLDGNAHVWSFSVQPTFNVLNPGGDGLGAYVLLGAGFYHKVTNFTTPQTGEECDYYYGCYEYQANAVVDHYTSNAPGFDAGIGFTYKVSHFSNVRLYAEGRYVVVLNSQRTGVNVNTPVNNTTIAVADEFAPNSNRTTYFPIKFGVRF